jgi:hypothetical protein
LRYAILLYVGSVTALVMDFLSKVLLCEMLSRVTVAIGSICEL